MKGKTMNILTVLRRAGLAGLLLLPALVPAATVSAGTAPQTPRSPEAAARHPGAGIINGQPAGDLTPKWIALVGEESNEGNDTPVLPVCTGEFITKRYVLTARHCVLDEDSVPRTAEKFRVAGGSGELNFLVNNLVQVHRIILPDDDPSVKNTDVALLDLEGEYDVPVGIAPLYHGEVSRLENQFSLVMGFGKTEDAQYSDLKMAKMVVDQWPATDAYGAPALRMKTGTDEYSGSVGHGDSGGPALLPLFNKNEPKTADFTKLAGVASSGSDFVGGRGVRNYTLLSDRVLAWLSDKTKITIIRSPADEQVFEPATQAITVSWYGGAPSRVELKTSSAGNENNNPVLAECSLVGANSCVLDVHALPGDTDYDIRVVRADSSVDMVTVRLTGYIPVEIAFPPKPENGAPFVYLPEVVTGRQTLYTVHGTAAAGTRLKARLTPQGGVSQATPCLNDNNQPLADITADERGAWVCNIEVSEQDKTAVWQYKFYIRKVNPSHDGDGSRQLDSVTFAVNGRSDNGSRISISPPDETVAYAMRRGHFILQGSAPENSLIIPAPPGSQGALNESSWKFSMIRPDTDNNNMPVTFKLHRNINDTWFSSAYLKPDAIAQTTINFVDAVLTRPVQTMVYEKASVITTIKTRGYAIRESLDPGRNPSVEHAIDAILLQDEGEDEQITTLCQPELRTGNWECPAVTSLKSGDYYFTDFVGSGANRKESRQALVHVVDDPLFLVPEQSKEASGRKVPWKKDGLLMKGIIPANTAAWAEKRKPSGSVDGTVTVYQLDDEGKKGTAAGRCDITVTASGNDEYNNWACDEEHKIPLPQPGPGKSQAYQAEVQFNSREDKDDIGGFTRFTLVPQAAVTVTTPVDGAVVTTQAVTPSGTGEKKQPLAMTLTGPGSRAVVRAGDSDCPVQTPACSTTVGDGGKWQCPPEAVTEEGEYTVRATECDGDKVLSEDSSTFTVTHKACPPDYPMNDKGDCEGEPKKTGGPGGGGGGGGGFGGSGGIGGFGWPFGLAGGCPVGSWLTAGKCIFPPGRHCPAGYTYDEKTQSCQGPADQNQCPSGYMLDGNTCSGPLPGGPDFRILSPAAGAEWDCRQDCYVYGQIPEGDTAVVTLNDPAGGQVLPGTGSYPSVVSDSTHPTLWRAGPMPVAQFPGRTLQVRAQRMHNGQAVPGVEALQALEVTTPSYVPYAVLWPTGVEEVKSETPDAIRGTAPTGTRVQVTTVPPSAACEVVSDNDLWTCPPRTFAPGEHRLTATWQGADAQVPAEATPVTRTFTAGPLPGVSITAPAAGARLSQGPYAIAGTGHPGATVTVTGMPAGPACEGVPVGADGTWRCGTQYPLVDGEWHLLATQTFGDGLSSAAAEAYSMSGQAQGVLTFDSPARDAVLREGTYRISGRGTPYAMVTVTGMPAGPACENVAVSMYGSWECPGGYPLQDGHYRLKAVATWNDGWQDTGMTAWREYSMVAPPGPVADITVLPGNNGCNRTTTISYTCTTVLHLSDAAGKAVPGQTVSATMSGNLAIKRPPTPDQLESDAAGNVTVTSGGTRDQGNGSAPWGTLKATAGAVTRSFLVPDQ
ncbi:trypsin-like serine protease [Enterobacter ludwigii]|uniref:trypsin-like serine protease n=1 Tax=Enterobacter ludwigii TaxID=299767 RepID=UPI003F71A9E0